MIFFSSRLVLEAPIRPYSLTRHSMDTAEGVLARIAYISLAFRTLPPCN